MTPVLLYRSNGVEVVAWDTPLGPQARVTAATGTVTLLFSDLVALSSAIMTKITGPKEDPKNAEGF